MSNRDKEREKAHDNTGRCAFEAIKEMVDALETSDDDAREAAQTAIQEDPLSVLVRDGWHAPGAQSEDGAEEYEILLSTGGPATRIIGMLGKYSEPKTARLEVQDWFVPWKEWRGKGWSENVLLDYARQFYFGD